MAGASLVMCCQLRVSCSRAPRLQVLAVAASAEATTEHPVAAAVVTAARVRGLPVVPGSRAMTVPGQGVVAEVEGSLVAVGQPSWALQAARCGGRTLEHSKCIPRAQGASGSP